MTNISYMISSALVMLLQITNLSLSNDTICTGWTVLWSNTVPKWNVQLLVRIHLTWFHFNIHLSSWLTHPTSCPAHPPTSHPAHLLSLLAHPHWTWRQRKLRLMLKIISFFIARSTFIHLPTDSPTTSLHASSNHVFIWTYYSELPYVVTLSLILVLPWLALGIINKVDITQGGLL